MELTLGTFLFVCPLLFMAGLVDAIGGGGGLISLPAYLIAGVPVHQAIATNKLSSTCGTTLATIRFIKNKLVNLKLAIPSVISAIIGSSIGAKLSLMMEEQLMEYILFIVLPVAALIVLNKKIFKDYQINDKSIALSNAPILFSGYSQFHKPLRAIFIFSKKSKFFFSIIYHHLN